LPHGAKAASTAVRRPYFHVVENVVASAYNVVMDDITAKSHDAEPQEPSDLDPATIERWLAQAVVPVYDAMQADPGRSIPAKDVAAALDALHAEWLKNGESGA
jgi:hypothetical protein